MALDRSFELLEALEERARRVLAEQTDTPLHREMQTLKKLLNRNFRAFTE